MKVKTPTGDIDGKPMVKVDYIELRDYIAIEAMKELIRGYSLEEDKVSKKAYQMADEMMKEKDK